MDKESIKHAVIPLLEKHGVARASLFGSFVHNRQDAASDVDLLIEFRNAREKSLLDLIALEQDIEETLKRKVDLVTPSTLHPSIGKKVLQELETFYDA